METDSFCFKVLQSGILLAPTGYQQPNPQKVSLVINLVDNRAQKKWIEMVPGCQPDQISRRPSFS